MCCNVYIYDRSNETIRYIVFFVLYYEKLEGNILLVKEKSTNEEMKLFAHITDRNGMRIEQSLSEHCIQTAKYAAESLQNIGFFHMAFLAGLLHDMGKATKKYNDYLEDAFAGKAVVRGSVNHTFAGVIYLFENYHNKEASAESQLVTEIISYAIGGHHGLFDCVDFNEKNGFMHRFNKNREELCYEEAQHNFFEQVTSHEKVKELFDKSLQEFSILFYKLKNDYAGKPSKIYFQLGLFARLLLSAVIYGDRRDTVEFMEDLSLHSNMPIDWKVEKIHFENQLARFNSESDINRIRSAISEQCLSFAERPTGVYKLSVPTGAGKTLSTLRYALTHAEKYQKKKIIFIIPLLSVLDQNVKVIREYVQNEKSVMEHHSNVVIEKEAEKDNAELDLYEVLTENWDSPIIVSTLVQFLDILFAHKTSMINRMRAFCDSIIIIDEVQSLPKKTIAMFNMAINFLSSYCNATVVLSSATQPCFEELKWSIEFSPEPDMVTLTKQQLQVFERAEIIDKTSPYGIDMNELVNFCHSIMESQESLLVICNTKSEAQNLFEQMKEGAEAENWHIYHLSTAMCKSHRTDILEELQEELVELQKCVKTGKEETKKIICISTQLVEAGIDFSFECVVRVMAGIDNLAQSAGRCNRSNEYGHKGKVYLINLKNENLSMLKEIRDAQNSTQYVLISMKQLEDESLIGEAATKKFYRNLFTENAMKREIEYPINEYKTKLFLADLLANENPFAKKDKFTFLHQPFKTIGKKFQVFDEQTTDILVPYHEGSNFIEELRKMEETSFFLPSLKDFLERTKNYTISIYQWQFDKLWEAGLLYGLFENRIFVLDKKAYHDQYGLNSKVELSVEDFIL